MWLGIGITLTVILLITILIAVCEVWCILDDIRTSQRNILEKVNVIISNIKDTCVENIQKNTNLGVVQ